MTEVNLTKADERKHVTVQAGDSIILHLEENPTTGFQWEIEGLDGELMRLSGTSFDLKSATAIGGGGMRKFQFTPKKPGTTRIALKRWRPWEGEASVIERFEVLCTID